MSAGRLAFANVRARAKAARLAGPEVAAHLRALREPAARAAFVLELGGAPQARRDVLEVHRARLARLLGDYAVLARSYPVGRELIQALAGLHEIENLKLLHRGVRRGLAPEAWRPAWRPLGQLAALELADAEEVRSARDLEVATADTPYAGLAGGEPDAIELALDRFGSRRLVDEVRRLPRAHADAGALVLRLVRERDLDALRRAAAYGVAPELAAGTAALLAGERGWERLPEVAAWNAEQGPLGLLLPRRLVAGLGPIADWDALEQALHRERRRACAAAFIGSPLRLAPGIAFLLLAEAEVRGLVALVEAGDDPAARGVVARAVAAGALGD